MTKESAKLRHSCSGAAAADAAAEVLLQNKTKSESGFIFFKSYVVPTKAFSIGMLCFQAISAVSCLYVIVMFIGYCGHFTHLETNFLDPEFAMIFYVDDLNEFWLPASVC